MIKYYEVKAKCGHVGRGYYFEGRFYVEANSAKEAARIVKNMPRVKHDHRDCILAVREYCKVAFNCLKEKEMQNPYYGIKSRGEQDWEYIKDRLYPETELQERYREGQNGDSRKEKIKKNRKGIRNEYKYYKYNYNPYDLRELQYA